MIAQAMVAISFVLTLTTCQGSRPEPVSCIAGSYVDQSSVVVLTTTCYRADGSLIAEDDPEWDCQTMGNRKCGL